VESAFQHVAVHEALELTLAAVRDLNKYLTDREPWKMKDKAQELQRATVVRTTLEAVYVLAHFLEPYLPEACAKVVEMLHTPLRRIKDLDPSFKNLKEGTVITVGEVLFKKIETEKAQKPIQTLELRVAKVESAVNHPTKDTLYLLQLDVGDEKRQVVSGLRAFYSAADLVGRKLLLFANLKPVKFGGELSSVSSPSSHSISQPSELPRLSPEIMRDARTI
jgi:methionyl-tRNA synthetase